MENFQNILSEQRSEIVLLVLDQIGPLEFPLMWKTERLKELIIESFIQRDQDQAVVLNQIFNYRQVHVNQMIRVKNYENCTRTILHLFQLTTMDIARFQFNNRLQKELLNIVDHYSVNFQDLNIYSSEKKSQDVLVKGSYLQKMFDDVHYLFFNKKIYIFIKLRDIWVSKSSIQFNNFNFFQIGDKGVQMLWNDLNNYYLDIQENQSIKIGYKLKEPHDVQEQCPFQNIYFKRTKKFTKSLFNCFGFFHKHDVISEDEKKLQMVHSELDIASYNFRVIVHRQQINNKLMFNFEVEI